LQELERYFEYHLPDRQQHPARIRQPFVFDTTTAEREREFIGRNIKQFHAKINLRRWDTEKNLQNRLSRRAPHESFVNFYRGLKLMAELVRM